MIWLALVSWGWSPAFAGSCGEMEAQIANVFRELARDQPGEAEKGLELIEASHPDCSQTLLARARIEAAKGQSSQAEDLFARYTNLEPGDARGYAYYAAFLIGQREYQRADAMSVVAMEKNSDDAAALAVRGHILDMKGQSDEGMTLLQKACELDPYLALSLETVGELDRVEKSYLQGLEVNAPGPHFDAFLDYNYGRFLTKRNQVTEAKIHLDRAVDLVPQMRATWYERAKLNLRLKNYQQARSDAEKAAAIADQAGVIIDLQVYVLLEQVYRRLGETELAQKYANLARETQVPIRGDHR